MWQKIAKVLVVSAGIAYPFLLHASIQNNTASGLRLLLLIFPLLLLACWLVLRAVGMAWRPLVVLAFLALAYFIASGQHERMGLVATSGALHALPNLFLMWFFGRTLQKGREPLITQISRRINGDVKPDILIYTRHVTLAWSIYFASQVCISLLLYLFTPLSVWSLFINVLTLPMLMLMFAGEYIWRITRYPHHTHASILKAIRVYTRDIATLKKT